MASRDAPDCKTRCKKISLRAGEYFSLALGLLAHRRRSLVIFQLEHHLIQNARKTERTPVTVGDRRPGIASYIERVVVRIDEGQSVVLPDI